MFVGRLKVIMKIAQVALLIESVPPRLYGGTERIVSYLVHKNESWIGFSEAIKPVPLLRHELPVGQSATCLCQRPSAESVILPVGAEPVTNFTCPCNSGAS